MSDDEGDTKLPPSLPSSTSPTHTTNLHWVHVDPLNQLIDRPDSVEPRIGKGLKLHYALAVGAQGYVYDINILFISIYMTHIKVFFSLPPSHPSLLYSIIYYILYII